MSEEKEESVLDTVKAAVDQQQEKIEPGPQIAAPEPDKKEEEPQEAPAEEPKSDDRERDTQGRFKTKEAQAEADKPPEAEQEEPKEAVQPDTKDISRPPKRLSVEGKQIWLSIPEKARNAIWEREAQIKRFDGLEQFAATAERNGTTLHQAVASYHQMETALRNDPISGFAQVLQAMQMSPEAVFQEIFRRMSGGAPPQGQQPPPSPAPTLDDLDSRLEQKLTQREINVAIKAFGDNPENIYFEDMKPLMAKLADDPKYLSMPVAEGLKDVYIKACRANGLDPGPKPNGSAAPSGQAQKAAAVTQSRQAAKATIGSPSPPKASAQAPDDGNQSIMDTVRAAMRKQKGE